MRTLCGIPGAAATPHGIPAVLQADEARIHFTARVVGVYIADGVSGMPESLAIRADAYAAVDGGADAAQPHPHSEGITDQPRFQIVQHAHPALHLGVEQGLELIAKRERQPGSKQPGVCGTDNFQRLLDFPLGIRPLSDVPGFFKIADQCQVCGQRTASFIL